jgi:hypothetical protein
MTTNQLIAVVALAVGAIDALAYLLLAMGRRTPLLRKLEPMQARWGRVPGAVVHFAAYVLLPLAVGTLLYFSDD